MARVIRRLRWRHPLLALVAQRLVALVFLAWGLTVIGFVLIELVPSNPVEANLGDAAYGDPAIVKAYRERYGLEKPIMVRYEIYLVDLLHGDLGRSQLSEHPVSEDLAEYIPATVELGLAAMALAIGVGVPLGVVAALRKDGFLDHISRLGSLGGMALPPFWLALLALYVFFYQLGWLPGTGRLAATAVPPPHVTGFFTIDALIAGQFGVFKSAVLHLILPASVLATFSMGLFTRFTRAAVLETLENDYVRSAWAKGLPSRIVIVRHVLRAAISPVITVGGLAFANVVTGSVFVESIFSWPGIGEYSFRSAIGLDLPAIVGVMLFVGLAYIIVNLCVDVLHVMIDPRVIAQQR